MEHQLRQPQSPGTRRYITMPFSTQPSHSRGDSTADYTGLHLEVTTDGPHTLLLTSLCPKQYLSPKNLAFDFPRGQGWYNIL